MADICSCFLATSQSGWFRFGFEGTLALSRIVAKPLTLTSSAFGSFPMVGSFACSSSDSHRSSTSCASMYILTIWLSEKGIPSLVDKEVDAGEKRRTTTAILEEQLHIAQQKGIELGVQNSTLQATMNLLPLLSPYQKLESEFTDADIINSPNRAPCRIVSLATYLGPSGARLPLPAIRLRMG